VFHCIYVPHFFIHSSLESHLGCFHILAIVNIAAVNIGVQVPFGISVFVFFKYIPRTRIAESHGNCIFRVLRNLHTLFHSDCNTTFLPTSVQVFPFLHILANICDLYSF
uniref:Uncharacterized protein n=1 Tax=Catagonus wagneri TaxID=51154 RepID=A0A8C3WB73_9CETA